ncbi:MAG: 4-hydroxythreonine-4-phosphate dehydrogenase PdxA [Candidatus Palauibacterales bacterium]|nr:4-hydroxythreonine-4-phosphate dehydrogenase PdxA [Candidatus Palauibacterales bacterium]MDP2528682.1 4-hydroxythreonine-4-phosphate dehydrogenase PdxA [Candidatus Palauibacterales bacterium]MDP2584243.1 4-hydroxythreonine-4-phosphate dehydrogenase PdxA [Candidatus Palauibacterales bacterium]
MRGRDHAEERSGRDAASGPFRVAITLGDPRGIGPEITEKTLRSAALSGSAEWVLVGPEGVVDASALGRESGARVVLEPVGHWDAEAADLERAAGEAAGRAVRRAAELALEGAVDGIVTAPLSKAALAAAGFRYPGHTEFLRELSGVPEVTMIMTAEDTPLGGPLRMAFLTGHIPLSRVSASLDEALAVTRSRIALRALRDWWGFERPRLAFAGLNPHASEGGLMGDEEARILEPAMHRLQAEGEGIMDGIHPADTVFRRCLDGRVDAVVVPYHDVGLAVLKTVAMERGVNVTAGLPFPRTSPDHGTAFDIAGRGVADPASMIEAVRLCLRFCGTRRAAAA